MRYELNFQSEPFETYSEFDEESETLDTELADLESEEEAGRRRRPRPAVSRARARSRIVSAKRPIKRLSRLIIRPPRPRIRPTFILPTVAIVQPRTPRPPGPAGAEPTGAAPAPADGSPTPPSAEPSAEGSEHVRWVQDSLNRILGLRLPVDGIMGPEVRSAVRSFQERQGLPITGLVGPDTERALIAASSGQSPGAGATKPDEPGMTEPPEPAATPHEPGMTESAEPAAASPAAEFEFEWETLDDAFEDAEQEADQTTWRSKRSRDFETATPAVPSRKTISRFNTDLNAPYFGGNFNFLYNGGSNEAVITYNTYLSYEKSFSERLKRQLIENLKQAVAVWNYAAEVQVKDTAGNYHDRIRLRFKCNIVTDSKNANKRTQVHPPGSRTVFFMDKDRENVMRDLNIYIGSSRNVLVHELGHVWGLLDEYKDRWISMKLSLGHVGAGSPLIKDKISIMNEGYADETRNNGEFRTRYFQHFGRAILGAFWGLKKYMIPVRHGGKVVSNTVQGRIALLKRDIAGNPPYTANGLPFNPVFTKLVIAKRS